jgi:hypothetical protein
MPHNPASRYLDLINDASQEGHRSP